MHIIFCYFGRLSVSPLRQGTLWGRGDFNTQLSLIGLSLFERCLNPRDHPKYVLHFDTCALCLLSHESHRKAGQPQNARIVDALFVSFVKNRVFSAFATRDEFSSPPGGA